MDLPIDHFRLLGVGPASDAQTVLLTLTQRLDRIPDQGFTTDTLQARAKLLQDSADLLSDPVRRRAYEGELTAVTDGLSTVPALDIPSSLEVAGLLLLLEAGQAQETFDLACRALQPPQAPALGSSREADLTLLAALACLTAAEDDANRRHFEAAARLLQQGLQLLQRMGQVPDLRQRLGRELDRLTPYLVLDLLSRELSSQEKRREGLALLEQLVQRRGGLEGQDDPSFRAEEFQAFFKQIRGFLTVQEQVDLFSSWAEVGSDAADFLATTALTASGFAQRKPERIAAARDRLLASGRSGIEPLLANLHLLLGEVDRALDTFAAGASREIKDWAARQASEPLGQLCAYCRDWLRRDVLPGYRDLEADPDLESYFSDRDVISWVEREDRRAGRAYAPPMPQELPPEVGTLPPSLARAGGDSFDWGTTPSSAPLGSPWAGLPATTPPPEEEGIGEEDFEEVPLGWRIPRLPWLPLTGLISRGRTRESLPDRPRDWRPSTWPLLWRLSAALGLGVLAFVTALLWRPGPPQQPGPGGEKPPPAQSQSDRSPASPPGVNPALGSGSTATAGSGGVAAGAASAAAGSPPGSHFQSTAQTPSGAANPITPLTVREPSADQLRQLLQTWLASKSAVLAGEPLPAGLGQIAREGPIGLLEQDRRRDAKRGETQKIEVRIDQVRIDQRSNGRIALLARLTYSDTRLNRSGAVVENTPRKTLRNLYIFGRDGQRWRLVANRPAG